MDCKYPNCQSCDRSDCDMEQKDIAAMLKRRRWEVNPILYRQKQQDYRSRIKASLPHCDECESCILVEKEKQDGYRRLCIDKMRLIEQKVSNCPQWCRKRRDKKKMRSYDDCIARMCRTGKYTEDDAKKFAFSKEVEKYYREVEFGKVTIEKSTYVPLGECM